MSSSRKSPRRPARPATDRASAADAYRLARHTILDGQRLDMQSLAAELGVNRVTLYRWVGSREQLIVDVLWLLTVRTFELVRAEVEDQPGPRVPEVMRRWVRLTVDQPGIRKFLHGESEFAMRLLTLRSGGFQPLLVDLVQEMLQAEVDTGRLVTPLPLDELAYTVVRIAESYMYLPAITGEPTDPDMLGRVLGVLLTGPAAA